MRMMCEYVGAGDYRLRVGTWRIIYKIDENNMTAL